MLEGSEYVKGSVSELDAGARADSASDANTDDTDRTKNSTLQDLWVLTEHRAESGPCPAAMLHSDCLQALPGCGDLAFES